MQTTIKERIEYLEKQVIYYNSINDSENQSIYIAVVNELNYWHKKEKEVLVKNTLQNAKEFLLKTNFEFFTEQEQNVIGKTMISYITFLNK